MSKYFLYFDINNKKQKKILQISKVMSSSFCGNVEDILKDPKDTLFLLPEYLQPLARECVYDSSSGNIATLLDIETFKQYNEVENFVSGVTNNFNWIPHDKPQSEQLKTLKFFVSDYLEKYKERTRTDFTFP